MRCHNNSGIHTQAYYHCPANLLPHNLHLSQCHNGQLVISELPDPRRTVCRGLAGSMSFLYLQRETASAKQDTLWQREGTVWAREKSMGDPQLILWPNTITFPWALRVSKQSYAHTPHARAAWSGAKTVDSSSSQRFCVHSINNISLFNIYTAYMARSHQALSVPYKNWKK